MDLRNGHLERFSDALHAPQLSPPLPWGDEKLVLHKLRFHADFVAALFPPLRRGGRGGGSGTTGHKIFPCSFSLSPFASLARGERNRFRFPRLPHHPPYPPFARGGKGSLARDVMPSRATKPCGSKSSLQLGHQLFITPPRVDEKLTGRTLLPGNVDEMVRRFHCVNSKFSAVQDEGGLMKSWSCLAEPCFLVLLTRWVAGVEAGFSRRAPRASDWGRCPPGTDPSHPAQQNGPGAIRRFHCVNSKFSSVQDGGVTAPRAGRGHPGWPMAAHQLASAYKPSGPASRRTAALKVDTHRRVRGKRVVRRPLSGWSSGRRQGRNLPASWGRLP